MMEAIGVDAFYNNKWGALGGEIVNPIGCADCHEPENMNLHISRPALIEAFERQGKGYYRGHSAGDALAGMCTVPRGILLQG